MDKKQIIGLVLIFGLFMLWSSSNSKARKIAMMEKARQDSIAQVQLQSNQADSIAQANLANQIQKANATGSTPAVAAKQDSIQDLRLLAQYGVFSSSIGGANETHILENDQVKLVFSSKGGKLVNAVIKEHNRITKDKDGNKSNNPIELMNNEKNRFSYLLPVKGVPGNVIDTEDLNFKASKNGNTLTFTAGQNGEFVQKYTLNQGYDLSYDLGFNNGSDIYQRNEDVVLKWKNHLSKLELNEYFEPMYSTVYFKEKDESSDYCSCRSSDTEEIEDGKIDWVSNSNQFFNTSLMARGEGFSGGKFETKQLDKKETDLKIIETELKIPSSALASGVFPMTLYSGPNQFETLRAYENGLEEIIPFGRSLFGTINRWVIRPMFNFFDNFVGSKGLAIILMIFLIKMVLYPLTYKMLHSQAKMGALKPELKSLKERYKDDPQTQQMETMKIYREYGVSPLGGCMPMLIQMPIWYALFRFFPASIEFRQESFWWADDLSSYDAFVNLPFEIPFMGAHLSLFTLLWVISQLVYTYYNSKHMDMSANPAMKYIQYVMPIMFLAFFNQYASGLTVYMFFSNLFNIVQTIGTKKFVFNEDKLRQQLMANKLKPKKKKSKFMANIEQAVKQQQEMKKNQNKGK